MTATDALRDRIAEAIHGRPLDGTEHPDDAECVRRCADDVLAVLADADPTDLGYEQVGWQLPEGGLHDDEWVPHYEHDLCEPVYTRPRTKEEANG